MQKNLKHPSVAILYTRACSWMLLSLIPFLPGQSPKVTVVSYFWNNGFYGSLWNVHSSVFFFNSQFSTEGDMVAQQVASLSDSLRVPSFYSVLRLLFVWSFAHTPKVCTWFLLVLQVTGRTKTIFKLCSNRDVYFCKLHQSRMIYIMAWYMIIV